MLRGVELGIDRETGVKKYRPLITVDSSCEKMRHEFRSYMYPKQRSDMVAKDVPLKVNDHTLDALRYFMAVWIGRFGIAPALLSAGMQEQSDPSYRSTIKEMLANLDNPNYGQTMQRWYA